MTEMQELRLRFITCQNQNNRTSTLRMSSNQAATLAPHPNIIELILQYSHDLHLLSQVNSQFRRISQQHNVQLTWIGLHLTDSWKTYQPVGDIAGWLARTTVVPPAASLGKLLFHSHSARITLLTFASHIDNGIRVFNFRNV